MVLYLGTQHKVILKKYLSENIFFNLTGLCRVIFFSLATPDMAFVLLLTNADSEKLLEIFSVDIKTFCIHPTIN